MHQVNFCYSVRWVPHVRKCHAAVQRSLACGAPLPLAGASVQLNMLNMPKSASEFLFGFLYFEHFYCWFPAPLKLRSNEANGAIQIYWYYYCCCLVRDFHVLCAGFLTCSVCVYFMLVLIFCLERSVSEWPITCTVWHIKNEIYCFMQIEESDSFGNN